MAVRSGTYGVDTVRISDSLFSGQELGERHARGGETRPSLFWPVDGHHAGCSQVLVFLTARRAWRYRCGHSRLRSLILVRIVCGSSTGGDDVAKRLKTVLEDAVCEVENGGFTSFIQLGQAKNFLER